MNRFFLCVSFLILGGTFVAFAQGSGTITGQIVDTSGAAVPGASVSANDLTSGTVAKATTAADGTFTIANLSPDRYLVSIEKAGFNAYTEQVSLVTQQSMTINAKMSIATLSQSVVVRGTVVPGARPMPTRTDVLLSNQSVRILDRKQLDAAGPLAGGAQMIALTPGANVIGYAQTGATKYTIQLNGIHQGWAGENTGFTAPGSLGVTFDGIPISDVATGLWQSATMPQNLLMQNLSVTYGPGLAKDRWYDNIGGQVEFTPIQPTVSHHVSVSATYGSYNQKNIAFVANTGNFHGWSTVIGGGAGNGDSFRQAPDGFANRSRDGAAFVKTIRMFSAGSFELGSYFAKSGGYRAQVIPLTDQGIIEPNGKSYSQATSGFYSTLPFDAYNKYDTNQMWILYGRENLSLNSTTSVSNMTWFMHIRRFHRRLSDIFASAGQIDEWNNPYSDAFGDEVSVQKVLPLNTLTVGSYFIHELYNTRNNFFDPAMGGNGAAHIVNIGAKFRSGYFDQDDISFFAEDDFHPIPKLHITPGVRWVGFRTGYSDQAQRDFAFAPGVVISTHCSLFPQGAGTDPFHNLFGTPNTTEQGSICGGHETRSDVEPSISAGFIALPWLTVYGGYSTQFRSPSLGGGGGMFQKVDPNFYSLAKGAYSQAGFKMHFTNAPGLKNFIVGAAYYHISYTNQELDFETAGQVQVAAGGSTLYQGVNAYFDDDPASNLHFFLNINGETSKFTNYIVGGSSLAECAADNLSCTSFNNLPVSYVPNATFNAGVYYGIMHNDHVLVEPRFSVSYLGSQHMFNNNTGTPDTATMPAYTTANLSFTGSPIKNINLTLSIQNLFNKKYNNYEYISSGGYFGTATGGYILAYPGAPLGTYGTISYQF